MINNPEAFVQIHEQDDYYELIDTRNQLVKDIQEYESRKNSKLILSLSDEEEYGCRLLCLAEVCRMIEERFREILHSPSKLNNYRKGLHQAMKISIDDDYRFDKSVDALNECFDKHYKAWMSSGCFLNQEKTLRAWFPKMALTDHGRLKAQSTTKAWINTLSEDGTIIRAYSSIESVTFYTEEPLVTFAKFPKEPYRYVGTFLLDLEITKPNDLIYRRIATEVDLTPWRK